MSKQKKKSDGPGAFAVIVLAGIAKYAFKSRHTGWILLVAAVLAAVFAVVWAVRKKGRKKTPELSRTSGRPAAGEFPTKMPPTGVSRNREQWKSLYEAGLITREEYREKYWDGRMRQKDGT